VDGNKRLIPGAYIQVMLYSLLNVGPLVYVGKQIQNFFIALIPDGAKQSGYRKASFPFYLNHYYVSGLDLKLNPSSLLGEKRSPHSTVTTLIIRFIVDTWRTNELRHNHSFCSIDDECSSGCYPGEFAKEYPLPSGIALLLNFQSGVYIPGCKIGGILLIALLLRERRLLEIIILKVKIKPSTNKIRYR